MSDTQHLLHQLETIRDELVDLAFTLDRQGALAAADVAMMVSARLGELQSKFSHATEGCREKSLVACPENVLPFVGQ